MRQKQQQRLQEEQNQNYLQQRCRRALCCSTCRLSISSEPETATSSSESSSERFATVSTLAHAMVQERLDQMIKHRPNLQQLQRQQQEKDEQSGQARAYKTSASTRRQRFSTTSRESSKFVLMVAMEKSTDEPREDFRASMVEMITANRIEEPRDLRRLLDYYVSVNSDECRGVILEVFHEVCSSLFFYSCKSRYC